jgi:hypothetical protein
MPAPDIIIERTRKGVRITNKGREKVRIITAILNYRYTVTSMADKPQSGQAYGSAYASRVGSERYTPMRDIDPGSSYEIEFYPPEIIVSVELVVEVNRVRHSITKNFM